MWCLKSSWINWGRAGDPLRGSSYFPAPPPCSWHFHKLPVWLRCPIVRTFWFLGLQTPLTGSCTQVQLCVPGSHSGPTDRVPQHKLLEKMLQFCTGSQREYLFLGCWMAWQPSSVNLNVIWDHSIVLTLWVDTDATEMRKARKNKKTLFQFSRWVLSDSLWPPGLQHSRLPCPSPTPEAYSNSCPLSQWCHLTISSSVIPFSSLLQSFPASGALQMSQFFTSGGQSIGALASASVLPMNIQDWFPLGSHLLAVQGTLKSLLQHHNSKASIRRHSSFFVVQLTHPYVTTGKTTALTRWTLSAKYDTSGIFYMGKYH